MEAMGQQFKMVVRCKDKDKEERLRQEVLREEGQNRRTQLVKAEVCWEEERLEVKWVEALQLLIS